VKELCERRWVKGTSIGAMMLLLALSLLVRSALQNAKASLDERQDQVAAVRVLQQSCELGVMPSESELAAVGALFPGTRLTCSRIGDAMYLTFEEEAAGPDLGPVVMQGR
jgi:hypothetical protein